MQQGEQATSETQPSLPAAGVCPWEPGGGRPERVQGLGKAAGRGPAGRASLGEVSLTFRRETIDCKGKRRMWQDGLRKVSLPGLPPATEVSSKAMRGSKGPWVPLCLVWQEKPASCQGPWRPASHRAQRLPGPTRVGPGPLLLEAAHLGHG